MAKALVDHPTFGDRDLSSIRAGNVTALLPQDQQVDADVPKANSLGMTETLGPHTFYPKVPLTPETEGSFPDVGARRRAQGRGPLHPRGPADRPDR
ncbi:MAG: hypothetical protein R2711_17220 [Acidimicrobiales bacterium]